MNDEACGLASVFRFFVLLYLSSVCFTINVIQTKPIFCYWLMLLVTNKKIACLYVWRRPMLTCFELSNFTHYVQWVGLSSYKQQVYMVIVYGDLSWTSFQIMQCAVVWNIFAMAKLFYFSEVPPHLQPTPVVGPSRHQVLRFDIYI